MPVPAHRADSISPVGHFLPVVELTSDEETLIAELDPRAELRDLIQFALSFNRDFRVIGLRVEEARALYDGESAQRFPAVAVGVQRNRQQFDNTATNERYGEDIAVASLGVSDFELDFFGRVRSLSDAARHDYLSTTYGQKAARSALVAEVASAYLSERLTTALEIDARNISDAQQRVLNSIERQQREGAVSLDDVELQRVELLRTNQRLADALSDHSRAVQALLLLTGYATPLPAPPLEGPELSLTALETPQWLIDLPSQRLLERFDVRQREESLKAANANIGAARAAFFPSIRLSTGVGVASDSLRTLFSSTSGAWLFSPQINLPLFDGGRNRVNLNLAQVRKDIAVAEYEKTIQNAFREIADVLVQRQQAVERVRSDIEMLAITQAKVRRLAVEMDAGSMQSNALLAASIRIAQADATWRLSRQNLLQNRLNLYRVLCGAEPVTPQSSAENGVQQ